MRGAIFDEMLRLQAHGWMPYCGRVEGHVYQDLSCAKPSRARWMHLEQKFVCLGCSKRCSLIDPPGFELLLPVTVRSKRLAFAELPAVSARDLLEKKLLLTVREVEFILSISSRTVYALLEEGVLERHPAPPTRITCESVRREAGRRRVG